MRPRRPRPDRNQAEIVRDLRNLGFVVHDVSSLGGEALDLFVGAYCHWLGRYVWLQCEVKSPSGRLTPDEDAYLCTFRPILPMLVAWSVGDILDWFEHAPEPKLQEVMT